MADKFNRNDLLVIPSDTKENVKEPVKYVISKLVKPVLKNGIQHFEVRWKNYPASENTTEPKTQLMKDVPKAIKQYEKLHKVKWFKNKVEYQP